MKKFVGLFFILSLFIFPLSIHGYYRKKVVGFKSFSFGGGGFFYSFNSQEIGDLISPELRVLFTFFDPGVGFGINIGSYRFSLSSDKYPDYFPLFHPLLVFSKHITPSLQFFLYGGGGFVRFQCIEPLCETTNPLNGWGAGVDTGVGLALAKFLSIEGGMRWTFPPAPFQEERYLFMKLTLGYFSSRYKVVDVPSLSVQSVSFTDDNKNGVLEPGESGILRVKLNNTASVSAKKVTVSLSEGLKGLFKFLFVKKRKITVGMLEPDKPIEVEFVLTLPENVGTSKRFTPGEYTIYVEAQCKDCKKVVDSFTIALSSEAPVPAGSSPPSPPSPPSRPPEITPPPSQPPPQSSPEAITHSPPPSEELTAEIKKVYVDDTDGNANGILNLNEKAFARIEVITEFSQPFTTTLSVNPPECLSVSTESVSLQQEGNKHLLSFPIMLKTFCYPSEVTVPFTIILFTEDNRRTSLTGILKVQTESMGVKECVKGEDGRCWVFIKLGGGYIKRNSSIAKVIYAEAFDATETRPGVVPTNRKALMERIDRCVERIGASEHIPETELEQLRFIGIKWYIELEMEHKRRGMWGILKGCKDEFIVSGNLYELTEEELTPVHSASRTKCSLTTLTTSEIRELIRSAVLELINKVECKR